MASVTYAKNIMSSVIMANETEPFFILLYSTKYGQWLLVTD